MPMPDSVLLALLKKYVSAFGPVVPVDLNSDTITRLNLTTTNPVIAENNLQNTAHFSGIIQDLLATQKATVGVGGYLENRDIYRRSAHFSNPAENRSLHLGVDIWMAAFTPILAPLAGVVHSFRDNNNFGDYGPTIILEHRLENIYFYTLNNYPKVLSLRSA